MHNDQQTFVDTARGYAFTLTGGPWQRTDMPMGIGLAGSEVTVLVTVEEPRWDLDQIEAALTPEVLARSEIEKNLPGAEVSNSSEATIDGETIHVVEFGLSGPGKAPRAAFLGVLLYKRSRVVQIRAQGDPVRCARHFDEILETLTFDISGASDGVAVSAQGGAEQARNATGETSGGKPGLARPVPEGTSRTPDEQVDVRATGDMDAGPPRYSGSSVQYVGEDGTSVELHEVVSAYQASGELPPQAALLMGVGAVLGIPVGALACLLLDGLCLGVAWLALLAATGLLRSRPDSLQDLWLFGLGTVLLVCVCVAQIILSLLGAGFAAGWASAVCVSGLGRLGKNRNQTAAAVLSSVSAAVVASAVAYGLTKLGASPLSSDLDLSRAPIPQGLREFLNSDIPYWVAVALRAIIGAGAAAFFAVRFVGEAKFCEDCGVHMRRRAFPGVDGPGATHMCCAASGGDISWAVSLLQVSHETAAALPRLFACPRCGKGYFELTSHPPMPPASRFRVPNAIRSFWWLVPLSMLAGAFLSARLFGPSTALSVLLLAIAAFLLWVICSVAHLIACLPGALLEVLFTLARTSPRKGKLISWKLTAEQAQHFLAAYENLHDDLDRLVRRKRVRRGVAILLPPVAVLLCRGGAGRAVANCILTLLGWIPGMVHAMCYVGKSMEDIDDEEGDSSSRHAAILAALFLLLIDIAIVASLIEFLKR